MTGRVVGPTVGERRSLAREWVEAHPARQKGCPHPSAARELPNGYDIVCGDCQSLVGTVALFPNVVLGRDEARELLSMLGDQGEGDSVRAKLTRAAQREVAA